MTKNRVLILATVLASLLLLLPAAFAQMGMPNLAHTGTDSLHRFADASVIEGTSSELIRTDDGVSMRISTMELEPGAVYTVWWVVFNNPGGCSPAMDGDLGVPMCGEDDIIDANGEINLNPLAQVSLLWAAGGMADMAGAATFSAMLKEGEAPGEVLAGPTLEDARKAEVHLVVRNHGQPSMDRLWAQLNTFEMAGCDACEDVQFSVFPPP